MELALVGVVVLLVALNFLERRRHAGEILELDKLHQVERRELASRIQRPDVLPTHQARVKRREPVARDHGALSAIGTVQPPKDAA